MTTPTTKKNGAAHPAPEQPTIHDLYVIGAMIGAMASGDVMPIPDLQDKGAMDAFVEEVYALAELMISRRNRT